MSAWRVIGREGIVTLGGRELRAYVITDGERTEHVLSARTCVAALANKDGDPSGGKDGAFARSIERLRPDWAGAIAVARFSFDGPTGLTHGYRATFFVDVCHAYVLASVNGQLHHKQVHLAVNAAHLLSALGGAGIEAVVAEATGNEAKAGAYQQTAENRMPPADATATAVDIDALRAAWRSDMAALLQEMLGAQRAVVSAPRLPSFAEHVIGDRGAREVLSLVARAAALWDSALPDKRGSHWGVVNAAVRKRIGHQGKWVLCPADKWAEVINALHDEVTRATTAARGCEDARQLKLIEGGK